MQIIGVPRGEAGEYAKLSLNLGRGCKLGGCVYCYNLKPGKRKPQPPFHDRFIPKPKALEKLAADAKRLHERGEDREIFLSFTCDPYDPAEFEIEDLTRQAIKILIANDLRFTILTKDGMRAERDFDLLAGYDKYRFGTTLVFTSEADAKTWEPGAPTIEDRIEAIQKAHDKGIKTWISLEPVIFPEQAIELVKTLHPIVDAWKVGKLNRYKPKEGQPKPPEVKDWIAFREEIKALLEALSYDPITGYYIKKSLTNLVYNAAGKPVV